MSPDVEVVQVSLQGCSNITPLPDKFDRIFEQPLRNWRGSLKTNPVIATNYKVMEMLLAGKIACTTKEGIFLNENKHTQPMESSLVRRFRAHDLSYYTLKAVKEPKKDFENKYFYQMKGKELPQERQQGLSKKQQKLRAKAKKARKQRRKNK